MLEGTKLTRRVHSGKGRVEAAFEGTVVLKEGVRDDEMDQVPT